MGLLDMPLDGGSDGKTARSAASPAAARECIERGKAIEVALHSRRALECYRALACYDEAISHDPRSAEAWVAKGELFLDMGEAKKANACHDRAVEIDPLCVGAWLGLGATHSQSGAPSDALSFYEKAIRLAPSDPRGWTGKGTCLMNLGRHEDALGSLDKALSLRPGHVNALNGKGCCLQRQGRHEEALASFDRTVALDPKHSFAWHNRGNALASLGRYEEAVASYRRALSFGAFAAALNGLGASLQRLGRTEEALACLLEAIELVPTYAEAWLQRGTIEQQLDRRQDAIRSLRRYLELAGDASTEVTRLARESLALLERAEASGALIARQLSDLDAALAARPADAETLWDKAEFLEKLGRPEEALACFRRYVELRPDQSEGWWHKAKCEFKLGRRPEQLRSLERFLAVAPPEYAKQIELAQEALCLDRQIAEKEDEIADATRQLANAFEAEARAALAQAETAGFRAVGWTCADLAEAVLGRAENEEDIRAVLSACCSIVKARRDAGWAADLGIPRQVLDQAIDQVFRGHS